MKTVVCVLLLSSFALFTNGRHFNLFILYSNPCITSAPITKHLGQKYAFDPELPVRERRFFVCPFYLFEGISCSCLWLSVHSALCILYRSRKLACDINHDHLMLCLHTKRSPLITASLLLCSCQPSLLTAEVWLVKGRCHRKDQEVVLQLNNAPMKDRRNLLLNQPRQNLTHHIIINKHKQTNHNCLLSLPIDIRVAETLQVSSVQTEPCSKAYSIFDEVDELALFLQFWGCVLMAEFTYFRSLWIASAK